MTSLEGPPLMTSSYFDVEMWVVVEPVPTEILQTNKGLQLMSSGPGYLLEMSGSLRMVTAKKYNITSLVSKSYLYVSVQLAKQLFNLKTHSQGNI
jgi:hypothetical protein